MRHTPAMTSLAHHVGPYRWKDFVALGEDDLRELIDGELVEVEVPRQKHEIAVVKVVVYLDAYTEREGGRVLGSGYKIRISDRRGVMPDVQLFRAGNEPGDDQDLGLERGRPDLVVEILSPTSPRYDRIVKLGYYRSIKVPEYWLVDPETCTLERLVLSEQGYVIASIHEGEETFAPPTFKGRKIPLARLWGKTIAKRAPKKRAAGKPKRRAH